MEDFIALLSLPRDEHGFIPLCFAPHGILPMRGCDDPWKSLTSLRLPTFFD